jgi:Zn-dependent protease with chaperone function
MSSRSPIRAILTLLLAASLAAGPARALPPGSTPRELELGSEAAESIAKAFPLYEDEETLAKLQRMLDEIAAQTGRPDIVYTPHLVASPDLNAFVVPGGYVYVTSGLLDAVQSDDELAGVLAHEIAHNVEQHALKRMRNAPSGLGVLRLATLAAVIGLMIGGAPEAAIVADAASNAVTAAVLNGSSVEAEEEADARGIDYLARTSYDPTGFLTFMERLANSMSKFYDEVPGIYRTHPLTRDRVKAAKEHLEELGRPILRRLVTDAPQPEARELVLDGAEVTEIAYRGERLFLLDGHDETRRTAALRTVGWTLDHELAESDIKIIPAAAAVVFRPEGGPAFIFTAADGRVDGDGEVRLAGRLRETLAGLVADEQARIRANYQLF